MRTQFGRLSNPKSGKGNEEEKTERDQWIYTTFAFLEKHIYRVPSRSTGKVYISIQMKHVIKVTLEVKHTLERKIFNNYLHH
jgi:hypothetical protein